MTTPDSRQKASKERPNIIWLMAEDMELDLACYGMRGVRIPNLDRMAAEGTRFTQTYCANPICSPNRSSMMTGVHQTVINAQHHRSNRGVPLPAPYKPITSFLRDAGYTCVLGSDLVVRSGRKTDWLSRNGDYGLEDLGRRQPERDVRSVAVREAVKEHEPQLWEQLQNGELMKTQQWRQYLRRNEDQS